MLRKFIPTLPALVLTCAWIPTLWTVESGVRVLGIGFLALYLRTDTKNIFNKGFLPISLGAAALCESGYMAFLLGHIAGTFLKRLRGKEAIVAFSYPINGKGIVSVVSKALLVLLVILTILFQSKRLDNNVHGIVYPWVPFPQTSILMVAILFDANNRYIQQNVPAPESIYQDWYFSHEKAFGGAQNIFQAILNNPGLFFGSIISNSVELIKVPLDFVFGFYVLHHPIVIFILLCALSWVLLPICFFMIFQYFKQNDLMPHIYSIVFGSGAVIAYLSLILFRKRYLIILLPVGLLMAAHIGASLQSLMRFPRRVQTNQSTVTSNCGNRSILSKIIPFAGAIFILLGLIANEWFLSFLLSKDAVLSTQLTKAPVWFIDLLLIGVGILFIIKPDVFLTKIKQIRDWSYLTTHSWFTNAITLCMASLVMFSTLNVYNTNIWSNNLCENPFLLSGPMTVVHRQLLASVNKTTKVLALEEPWIRSFADVDIDKVFHEVYLPPFEDKSGKTEKFLDSLDVIWVSSMAPQPSLRYKLHVKPFLEKALKTGWTVQEVDGFGKIYRRPRDGKITEPFPKS
jgi:hypothetical protein